MGKKVRKFRKKRYGEIYYFVRKVKDCVTMLRANYAFKVEYFNEKYVRENFEELIKPKL